MDDDRSFGHLLVTGGAGFIGSCYVRNLLARRDGTHVTVLDKLTYAGNEANLRSVRDDPEQTGRLAFVQGDIADPAVVMPLVGQVDAVVNFAAESHVDRSILDPEAFLATGVIGVHVLLEACRTAPRRPRFLQVSTDEVYGSVDEGHATEDAPLAPRSPYAAAKAAGELLVRSYVITHGIDAVVTRGSNTYGPYHHPEKLIPLFITNAIDDAPLPLYGDGLQRRDWLYVGDHAAAIDFVLHDGVSGETYNVAGNAERTNRDVVALLLERLGKPWSLVRTVEDRPGHDRRYAMDGSKLAALGWQPQTSFEDGLAATVDWFRSNEAWWRATRSGDWDGWYQRQYAQRFATSAAAAPTPAEAAATPPRRGSDADRGPADADERGRNGAERGRRHTDPRLMRVAVTGAGGRLGRALIQALEDAPFTGPAGPIAWHRAAFDLDAPDAVGDRLERDRPDVVVHAAAWTDVDGCALDPELALRRNGVATGVLAAACAARGTDLLVISTNEVFAGETVTGRGHLPTDRPDPGNPYGASKAEGERLAAVAFADTPDAAFGIARTAWLFGAPGQDFPSRILDAAERARDAGDLLKAVGDEWGTPSYTADVADAIVELLGADALGGIHHLVNGLTATRADWARYVVARAGIDVEVVNVPMSTWERPSRPPRWGVLAQTPLPSGEPMRVWPDAMADYAPALLRARRAGQVRA